MVGLAGDVDGDEPRPPPFGLDEPHRLLCRLLLGGQVGDDDRGAGAGEGTRGRAADALRGAGHEPCAPVHAR